MLMVMNLQNVVYLLKLPRQLSTNIFRFSREQSFALWLSGLWYRRPVVYVWWILTFRRNVVSIFKIETTSSLNREAAFSSETSVTLSQRRTSQTLTLSRNFTSKIMWYNYIEFNSVSIASNCETYHMEQNPSWEANSHSFITAFYGT
jgi:hypothetical protein